MKEEKQQQGEQRRLVPRGAQHRCRKSQARGREGEPPRSRVGPLSLLSSRMCQLPPDMCLGPRKTLKEDNMRKGRMAPAMGLPLGQATQVPMVPCPQCHWSPAHTHTASPPTCGSQHARPSPSVSARLPANFCCRPASWCNKLPSGWRRRV